VSPQARVKLVTLSAESDTFPDVAKAATSAMSGAKLTGVDETIVSKVSIEVVQLSIECVDATTTCSEAAAKSLQATKLLFASIDNDGKKPKIAVTVFDVGKEPHTTERVFDSEAQAVAGVDKLVTEATR
jgi:hypothetical protein